MRAAVFSLVAVAGLEACTAPSVDVGAETAAVRARSEAVVAAEAAQNTEAALAFWAEDAVVQPAGSPQIQGHEAIRALYNNFFGTGQLKQFEGTPRTWRSHEAATWRTNTASTE